MAGLIVTLRADQTDHSDTDPARWYAPMVSDLAQYGP